MTACYIPPVWPCCTTTVPCAQPYSSLPIRTGDVGIDRCGNIVVYAAPRVVYRPVSWDAWPIPYTSVGPPGTGGLAALMTGGAAAAMRGLRRG